METDIGSQQNTDIRRSMLSEKKRPAKVYIKIYYWWTENCNIYHEVKAMDKKSLIDNDFKHTVELEKFALMHNKVNVVITKFFFFSVP